MLTDVANVAILLPAELIAELPAELPQYHVRHRKKKNCIWYLSRDNVPGCTDSESNVPIPPIWS